MNTSTLAKEKETLFITLHAKAMDSSSGSSILNDKWAEEILKSVDYNFKKFEKPFGNDNIIVVRAKQMDDWIREFLIKNPAAVVLNLGCGLDTRISRINPISTISWFDIDYPEVIMLRKDFFPERPGYQTVPSSITQKDWLNLIPTGKQTLIVAEGVLEYLTEQEVKALLNMITNHFKTGQVIFDVMNSFAINAGKAELEKTTGALHKWAVDDVSNVDKLDSSLKRISNKSVFKASGIKKLSFKYRLIYSIMSLFPQFRGMIRILRYQF